MFKKEGNSITSFALILILLFIFFYILYIWASLIIPSIIALLFSFAIIGLSNFYKKFKIPAFISFTLSLLTYSWFFGLVWKMIWSNIDELITLLPEYQNQVVDIVSHLFSLLNIAEPTSVLEVLQQINLQYVFTLAISWVTSIFSSAGLILFYVLFILLEYRNFNVKLNLMIWENSKKSQILETLDKIKSDVKSYFVIKTFVSLLTAVFSYLVMISFWLDFAIFWSILVFILNFIPNVWSIIAVIFPSLLSLVQPGFSYYDAAIMISWLAWIQIFVWNIVEPRFMWNKLNLSPLVIILALGFWWTLWWVTWMLLSVPLMVIVNIILAKIPVTKPLAILLSEKWDLQVDWWDEVLQTRRQLLNSVRWVLKVHKKKKKLKIKKINDKINKTVKALNDKK